MVTDNTIRCECGNAVALRSATRYDGGDKFVETYECPSGHTGTLHVNSRGEQATGCLA